MTCIVGWRCSSLRSKKHEGVEGVLKRGEGETSSEMSWRELSGSFLHDRLSAKLVGKAVADSALVYQGEMTIYIFSHV